MKSRQEVKNAATATQANGLRNPHYPRQQGWAENSAGALEWVAGNSSPDVVRADPDAAIAQREREKYARRQSRGPRGFRRNPVAQYKYAVLKGEQRRQRRANKALLRRSIGSPRAPWAVTGLFSLTIVAVAGAITAADSFRLHFTWSILACSVLVAISIALSSSISRTDSAL